MVESVNPVDDQLGDDDPDDGSADEPEPVAG